MNFSLANGRDLEPQIDKISVKSPENEFIISESLTMPFFYEATISEDHFDWRIRNIDQSNGIYIELDKANCRIHVRTRTRKYYKVITIPSEYAKANDLREERIQHGFKNGMTYQIKVNKNGFTTNAH